MFFRKKNRRRVDMAKKPGELKAAAKHHAPTAFRVALLCVLSAAMVYGGLLAHRFVTTAQTFALRRITVTGNDRASEAAVLKLSSLAVGTNLFALDTAALERAVATHPWVKQASVHRHLPSSLRIDVVEHDAVAMMSLGDLYLVNSEGEPFKRVQATEPLDLPLVTGIEREDFVARREESLAVVQHVLGVIAQYSASAASKGHPISEAHVDDTGVTLFTSNDGEEIRLGEGQFDEKLQRLARVRHELATQQLTAELIRLDNRARPNWVTVQPKTNTAANGWSEKTKRVVK